jgi:RNA-directed DNA polymerase
VKDRVRQDIGAEEHSEWTAINWKLIKKRVSNLRQRIFRASQAQAWNQVRSLMKLMLRSQANLLLAIKQVTQINLGRKTAGIDGQKALTNAQRMKLYRELTEATPGQAKPVKRVYIPKANGKLRPLGIPVIKDRVLQAVVKNALEPSWEARFESRSYGFRPGRSVQDAITYSHIRLSGDRGDSWILDADIQGAFDHISHTYLLSTLGDIPGKALIKQWLKAGYLEQGCFHPTTAGVPQGGVISPLLANIALHGLEELLAPFKNIRVYQRIPKGRKRVRVEHRQSPRYGYCRYADDLLITAKTQADIEAIVPIVQDWLQARGLQFNPEKTRIVSVNEGFDFLGFHIQKWNGKCLTCPQKAKTLAFLSQIRHWLKHHRDTSPADVIRYLNPILRGWANFYRHGSSARVFRYVDCEVWKALWRWACKRHPHKSKWWIARKYFSPDHRDWRFKTTVNDRQGQPVTLRLLRLGDIPITRHVLVSGTASPDDPTRNQYWEQRRTQFGKKRFARGSKLYALATQQQWKCPICGEHLLTGEEFNLHHKVKVKDGGSNADSNLELLHASCHRDLHAGETPESLSRMMG